MNYIRYTKKILLLVVAIPILASCVTPAKVKSKAVLIEHPERCFWEIKGESGSVYVLGTIHLADKSFFPLEKNVLQAFDSADRLVSELGGKDEMQSFGTELQTALMQHHNTDPQKNLLDILPAEDLAVLYEKLGEDTIHQLAMFNPWILNTIIAQVLLYEAGLDSADGIDIHLIQRAENKHIEALDTIEQQIAVLSYGTFEDQLAMLKDSIQALKDSEKNIKEIQQLRQLYLNNDRQGLTALLPILLDVPDSFSVEKKNDFITVLLTNRNRIWAKKFHQYLQAGGTTFVFAGIAHFIGDSNVFEIMRKEHILQ